MDAPMLKTGFGQAITSNSVETTGELIDMVTISEKDFYVFPAEAQRVRVVSGDAWISYCRRDIILRAGQEYPLDDDADTGVATSLGRKTVMLAIYR